MGEEGPHSILDGVPVSLSVRVHLHDATMLWGTINTSVVIPIIPTPL